MSPSPMPTAAALATRQLWLTALGGVALALPLTLVLTLALDWQRLVSLNAASWLLVVLKDWLSVFFAVVGTAILPALASAGLRWPLMRRLLARCRALGPGRGRRWALLGTLLLFEATVALAAGLGFGLLYPTMSLAMCGWLCTAFSLPWLLAALGATWHVLRPVGQAGGLAAN